MKKILVTIDEATEKRINEIKAAISLSTSAIIRLAILNEWKSKRKGP